MDNPEEILHSLEEFAKLKPKDIPRELEEYLSFVAKTGDPVYQWGTIKSLFREKLINVITELYESCPSVEIPPSPNVEVFNYEKMKNFILEKLDTFVAAPFTVQRICELLTTPRKEYNRIDKYMRALEKNILVVSTIEPGNRRTENGEGIVNGVETDHYRENQPNNDINVEDIEMEDSSWPKMNQPVNATNYQEVEVKMPQIESVHTVDVEQEGVNTEIKTTEEACSSTNDTSTTLDQQQLYVSIEPVTSDSCLREDGFQESSLTITTVPAPVQKRRDSIEPVEQISEDVSSSETQTTQENEVSLDQSSSENANQQFPEVVSSASEIETPCSELAHENSKVGDIETTEVLNNAPTQNESTIALEHIEAPVVNEETSGSGGEPSRSLEKCEKETEQKSFIAQDETQSSQPVTETLASQPNVTESISNNIESNISEAEERTQEESAAENALNEKSSEESKSNKEESTTDISDPIDGKCISEPARECIDTNTKMLENEPSEEIQTSSCEVNLEKLETEKKMDVDLESQKVESKEMVTTE